MPYVNVPNDLSKIKTKIAFNLTKRQLICFGIGAVGFWRPISGLCGGTRILHRAPPAPADCAALLPFRCFWSAAALHRSFFVAANPVIMCALPVCRLLLEWWRGDWL